jgi:hypothetical protein
MFVNNRKAQGFSPVKVLILCLVAGILLIIIGYKIVQTQDKSSSEEKCRLSIFAKDKAGTVNQASVFTPDLTSQVSFECPANEVVVKKSGIVVGGKVQPDKIKDVFLREMFSCYRKTGAGKLDPFKKYWGSTDDSFCLICSRIKFDSKLASLASEQDVKVMGFPYYLAVKKVPGQKVTLYQATHGGSMAVEAVLAELKKTESDSKTAFDLNQEYDVVWRFEKYEPGALFYVGAAVGAAGATVLGVAAIVGSGGTVLLIAGGVAVAGLATEVASAGSMGTRDSSVSAGQSDAFGILVRSVDEGSLKVDEQIWVVPEEKLSGKYPNSDKDFCGLLMN